MYSVQSTPAGQVVQMAGDLGGQVTGLGGEGGLVTGEGGNCG